MQWKYPRLPTSKKFKVEMSEGKVLIMVCENMQGIILAYHPAAWTENYW
jgi:hypothetical protein